MDHATAIALDMKLVRWMYAHPEPVTAEHLAALRLHAGIGASVTAVEERLIHLQRHGYVVSDVRAPAPGTWSLSELGHTLATEGRAAAPAGVDAAPSQPPVADPAPDVAICCIREQALDDWWNEQDVDIKTDVFLLWTLGATGVIGEYDNRASVPVAGTVGQHEAVAEEAAAS